MLGQELGVLAQPVAGAFDLDDGGVVQEAVEQCGGDDGVAEHLAPFGEAAVGGEDHGPLFVSGVDQLEEQIAAAGSFTAAWSKKINRIFRDLGITDRRKVFHSFRHNFKDACRRAGIQEAVHDALTGHSNGSVGRNYGLGYRVAELAEAMNKITYPAVDFSHLEVDQAGKAAIDPAVPPAA